MGEFSPWHLLIVAFVFLVLFGSKKLPGAARSLGRSLRIFKAETQVLREDPTSYPPATSPAPTPLAQTPPSTNTAASAPDHPAL